MRPLLWAEVPRTYVNSQIRRSARANFSFWFSTRAKTSLNSVIFSPPNPQNDPSQWFHGNQNPGKPDPLITYTAIGQERGSWNAKNLGSRKAAGWDHQSLLIWAATH
jgi:hypothetical protein